MPKIGKKLYTQETYDFLNQKKMLCFFKHGTRWTKPQDNNRINLHRLSELIFISLGNKCKICMIRSNLEIDHITPLYKKGTNELVNLQLLCNYHHTIKTKIDRKKSIIL